MENIQINTLGCIQEYIQEDTTPKAPPNSPIKSSSPIYNNRIKIIKN
jgi:hypothetical protein